MSSVAELFCVCWLSIHNDPTCNWMNYFIENFLEILPDDNNMFSFGCLWGYFLNCSDFWTLAGCYKHETPLVVWLDEFCGWAFLCVDSHSIMTQLVIEWTTLSKTFWKSCLMTSTCFPLATYEAISWTGFRKSSGFWTLAGCFFMYLRLLLCVFRENNYNDNI